jgi:hypothetical protein
MNVTENNNNYLNIFRNGTFYKYDIKYLDVSWSDNDIFIVTSLYASIKHKGHDDKTAYYLSSMYVYQKTMPGLSYTSLGNNIIPHSTKKNIIV